MKIQRINITIYPEANKRKPLLYNYCLDLMKKYKCGGLIANEFIKLNGISDKAIKDLKN